MGRSALKIDQRITQNFNVGHGEKGCKEMVERGQNLLNTEKVKREWTHLQERAAKRTIPRKRGGGVGTCEERTGAEGEIVPQGSISRGRGGDIFDVSAWGQAPSGKWKNGADAQSPMKG